MTGYPRLGNISAEVGSPLCYNCKGEGFVTVPRMTLRRDGIQQVFSNRIECPICKGAGVRESKQREFVF